MKNISSDIEKAFYYFPLSLIIFLILVVIGSAAGFIWVVIVVLLSTIIAGLSLSISQNSPDRKGSDEETEEEEDDDDDETEDTDVEDEEVEDEEVADETEDADEDNQEIDDETEDTDDEDDEADNETEDTDDEDDEADNETEDIEEDNETENSNDEDVKLETYKAESFSSSYGNSKLQVESKPQFAIYGDYESEGENKGFKTLFSPIQLPITISILWLITIFTIYKFFPALITPSALAVVPVLLLFGLSGFIGFFLKEPSENLEITPKEKTSYALNVLKMLIGWGLVIYIFAINFSN